MNRLSKRLAVAAALGMTAIAASPAAAQDWYGDGPRPGWSNPDYGGYDRDPYGRDGHPRYGDDDEVDTGIRDIAVCPYGYHLGRTPGLCWPD